MSNIFDLHKNILENYRLYIDSFLNITDGRISDMVHKEFESDDLCPEPLIQFNPSFESGGRVEDLINKGVLDPAFFGRYYKGLRHDLDVVDYLIVNDRVWFTIHLIARKEILKRLLELNYKIHAEEVAAGLWDKKTTKEKKNKNKGSEPSQVKEVGYGDLFGE